ncbi:MAG: LysE family translocator [Roseovarius sp.]|nr:LysE family translocator [Roseovarius sp.]
MSVAVLSFLAFGASQVATPGPANMALMSTGARYGLRASLPFVLGVTLGKQLLVWPMGFGLMELATGAPGIFATLKWACVAYICWLAWKIANLRLSPGQVDTDVPGFMAGLLVHPLNSKAWAMIAGGFTSFVTPDTSALQATATIAGCLFALQVVLHPTWAYFGEQIARTVAGTTFEPYLMRCLAALTVASVLFVLFAGAGS